MTPGPDFPGFAQKAVVPGAFHVKLSVNMPQKNVGENCPAPQGAHSRPKISQSLISQYAAKLTNALTEEKLLRRA